jgi:uncharacterized protein with NRDE domain
MCVLAFAWRAHPRWRLVAAGNRDELHTRPSTPLERWRDPQHVLAGRDQVAGGAWLGVSEQGRFAVVTNLRGFGESKPAGASRGALVSSLLAGERRHAGAADSALAAFNPFNVIFVDDDRAQFVSNRPEIIRSILAPGIYGLSNGALDAPWPKTLQLKAALLDWIVAGKTDPGVLLHALRQDVLPEVGVRSAPASDVTLEPAVSPVFIRHPVYGTRCSTVVTVDDYGRGEIVERRYASSGEATGDTTLSFSWPR